MMGLVVCLLIGLLETTATSVLPVVGGILVLGPLEYGMAYIFLKQARDGQPVQMGDIFRGFQDDFGGTLLIGLMTGPVYIPVVAAVLYSRHCQGVLLFDGLLYQGGSSGLRLENVH